MVYLSVPDIATVFDTVVNGRTAAYASAPITSGLRLFDCLARFRELNESRPLQVDDDFKHTVVQANLDDAGRFVAGLRCAINFPVIDPSRLPSFPEWKQAYYYALWEAVVRHSCEVAVFIDGWEYSSGCTHEYLVAQSAGIATYDSHLEPLEPSRGSELIRSAILDLERRGLAPTILATRLQDLRRRAVTQYDASEHGVGPDPRELCSLMLGCVLPLRSAVFVAAPLCSGGYDLSSGNRRERIVLRPKQVADFSGGRATVRSYGQLVDATRRTFAQPIIDPSRFLPTGWGIRELAEFWAKAVARHAEKLVLGNDWYFSEECVLTFCEAVRQGIEVFDSEYRKLPVEQGIALIADASSALDEHSVTRSLLISAVADLRKQAHGAHRDSR